MQHTLFSSKEIPQTAGVYLFKDSDNTIIYIGKAKNLAKRVQSYNTDRHIDWKIKYILKKTKKIEWIETKNEQKALVLEADLISTHKPPCNRLLTSKTPFTYIIFKENSNQEKEVILSRFYDKKKDFIIGPFVSRQEAYKLYTHIMTLFNLKKCGQKISQGCLHYHLSLCAGSCLTSFDKESYNKRYFFAISAIKRKSTFLKDITKEIKEAEKKTDVTSLEKLYSYRENYNLIEEYIKKISHRPETEVENTLSSLNQKDDIFIKGMQELESLLNHKKPILTVDCMDISHIQGNALSGAIVRFVKGKYRQEESYAYPLQIKRNDDYKNLLLLVKMHYEKNDYPDLLLIDGGKGQLQTIKTSLKKREIICIALTKKEECLFGDNLPPEGILISPKTAFGKLLITLRNATHNTAIQLHKKLRLNIFFGKQRKSTKKTKV
jgi:excinuclease ABC subunit C